MDDVQVDEVNGCLVVRGRTYPFKDDLKRLGFRWRYNEKCWRHPVASHRLRVQVAQVLGRSTVAEPSHIHFYSQQQASENPTEQYNYDDNTRVVNVHFIDDDAEKYHVPQTPPVYQTRPPPPPAYHYKPRSEYENRENWQQYQHHHDRDRSVFFRSPPPRMEELFVNQRPAIQLEVFCPSDDDDDEVF